MTIGHHRITIGHYFFSISKHKANTTELHPKVRQTCPSQSQMRSWPWPSTSSTPPHSDAEESAYEKLQRENIKEKERRLAELEIASEVESVKKPRKRKTKTSSSEPIRKSRRLADKR